MDVLLGRPGRLPTACIGVAEEFQVFRRILERATIDASLAVDTVFEAS